MPATMKAAALKAPWASSMTQPAVSAAGVPQPNTAIISPSWLIVPKARSSLRSCWRIARRPPPIIVTTPTVTTTGRHRSRSTNAGARRATRYTPALTIVAECR